MNTVHVFFLHGFIFRRFYSESESIHSLVIVHPVLNRGWYHSVFRKKKGRALVLQVINLLLIVISGILINQEALPLLHVEPAVAAARRIHLSANGWFFVLAALDAGMHRRMMPPFRNGTGNLALQIAEVAVTILGFVFFAQSDLPQEMLLQTEYAFLDYESSFLMVYLRNLCMFLAFMNLSAWLDLLAHPIRKQQ